MPATPTDDELDRLVVSSGDFGLAYLTERWAARFVGELFRNYVVCFVGYSINDPVLRYMMDALAADRLLGESPAEVFAFGSYSKGRETDVLNEWEAKNVTPILYREYRRHFYMHRTLRVWANTYRDGGKADVNPALVSQRNLSHDFSECPDLPCGHLDLPQSIRPHPAPKATSQKPPLSWIRPWLPTLIQRV